LEGVKDPYKTISDREESEPADGALSSRGLGSETSFVVRESENMSLDRVLAPVSNNLHRDHIREDGSQVVLVAHNDSNQLGLIPEDEMEAWKREAQLVALGW
jgi:hypothetical protein